MDRQLTNKEIRNERRKKLLRTGIPAVAAIALAAWGISALGVKSVKASSLSFSGVDKGDIDVSISASGRIVPAYEEIIISPIDSRILSVRHTAGDIVEAGEPLLTLDLQAAGIAAQKLSDQLRMKKLELEQQLVGDNTALAKLEMEIKVRKMNVQKLEAELRNERYMDSLCSGTTERAVCTPRANLPQKAIYKATRRQTTTLAVAPAVAAAAAAAAAAATVAVAAFPQRGNRTREAPWLLHVSPKT
ncbi:MAG: efflux RND transporter periplasmic adaptor subunit [Muribaculaceae bacterium]|nr:efflux RND transporter periplasmic adaptor subunit [Muribaculaceae bacterium]